MRGVLMKKNSRLSAILVAIWVRTVEIIWVSLQSEESNRT